jgi:hypothetical protein
VGVAGIFLLSLPLFWVFLDCAVLFFVFCFVFNRVTTFSALSSELTFAIKDRESWQ